MSVKVIATSPMGLVVEGSGIVYLLTTCCNASGKGSLGAEPGELPAVVCRNCYSTVDDLYGAGIPADDAEAIDQFVVDIQGERVEPYTLGENVPPTTDPAEEILDEMIVLNENEIVDEPAVGEDEPAPAIQGGAETPAPTREAMINMQVRILALRKELNMSRRELSVELGWTESRVWYLEQDSINYDNARNGIDLVTMLAAVENALKTGWKRPTVSTRKATPATKTAGVLDPTLLQEKQDEIVRLTETLSQATKAMHEAEENKQDAVRRTRTEANDTLDQIVREIDSRIEAAKAKKAATAALKELRDIVAGAQWTV